MKKRVSAKNLLSKVPSAKNLLSKVPIMNKLHKANDGAVGTKALLKRR